MNREDAFAVIKDHILRELAPDESPASINADTNLITGGVIDSVGALQLVSFLERKFHIEVATYEVTAANLDTLHAIVSFIERKRIGS